MKSIASILLITNRKNDRLGLRGILEQSGYVVIDAISLKRAYQIIAHQKIDLILLGLYLKDGEYSDFLITRKGCDIPIVVFEDDASEETMIKAYDMGANDFIDRIKNFTIVKAKINLLMNYTSMKIKLNDKLGTCALPDISFLKWRRDSARYQFFDNNDNSANLTLQEYTLLNYLIENVGKTVTRTQLAEVLRHDNYIPSQRSIDIKITRLRKKLGDDKSFPKIILTVRGVGYLFNTKII